jgi:hypothetical protein
LTGQSKNRLNPKYSDARLAFLLNSIFDLAVTSCGSIALTPNNVKIALPARSGAENSLPMWPIGQNRPAVALGNFCRAGY